MPNQGINTNQYNSVLENISQIYKESLKEGNQDWNKSTLFANWKMGQLISGIEDKYSKDSTYGKEIILQLSKDLSKKYKRGFSTRNLWYFKKFYSYYTKGKISNQLSWSHYIHILRFNDPKTRLELERKVISDNLSHIDLLNYLRSENKGLVKTNSDKSDKKTISSLKKPPL
jgi:hypothetical protein